MQLLRHPLSLVGGVLALVSAVLFLGLYLVEWLGLIPNPYAGLLIFVLLPLVFLVGLLLIPSGWVVARRQGPAGPAWPRLDLNLPRHRRAVFLVSVLSAGSVVILATASLGAVHYMDSASFCGQVCHGVMQPEFDSHQQWPHARVACVACHVGPGAPSYMKAKVAGARRLLQIVNGPHERAVMTPIPDLRPAQETCGQCHNARRWLGDRLVQITEYADDEESSETTMRLRMLAGGRLVRSEQWSGIHWHADPDRVIEYYAADDARQEIPYVRWTGPDGTTHEFVADGASAADFAARPLRRMDCLDCHNRPAHTFVSTAERAIDRAIWLGGIDRGLPYIRREAVAAVKEPYPTQEAGLAGIADRLRRFYRDEYPADMEGWAPLLDESIEAVQQVYRFNVFPMRKVSWGTYPNNIGHMNSPGCFRCHDEGHRAADGTVIRQDCELCHAME